MATIEDNPKREDVLKFISSSASYGNLGLFVGAGFCKAVLNNGLEDIALSWNQLLEKASEQLEMDYSLIPKEGSGYPEIASRICQAYADNKNKSFSQGASRFAKEIDFVLPANQSLSLLSELPSIPPVYLPRPSREAMTLRRSRA